jgi:uncharacterized membrane protein
MFGSPAAVIAILSITAAFFFFLEKSTKWKVFEFFPPLLFIYATPVLLSNTGVIPTASPAYDVIGSYGLPIFIVLLLVGINIGAAFRIMGRGVLVMLLGTAGIVVGGPIGYLVVHRWLSPDAWKGFGALAGSWIGGTGNMAAVSEALQTPGEIFGLAVIADQAIYVIWLPILLGSKAFAERFNRWTGVEGGRIEKMEAAIEAEKETKTPLAMRHFLYMAAIGFSALALANWVAPMIPEVGEILSTSTWRILLLTTFGILLSLTPVRRIPHTHEVAMAIVYVFVARMGAMASLEGLAEAPAFLLGAAIWISIHGAFCLFGAWIFKVDVHSAAIASAANVGGAASAPVVAAYHRESLVPVSILMALIGYALGTYLALLTARLCLLVGGG